MYFHIWKSPLIILLFLGYKAISVAGGKVLSDITDHICILSYTMCAHCWWFCCCAAVNPSWIYICMIYASIPTEGRGICEYYEWWQAMSFFVRMEWIIHHLTTVLVRMGGLECNVKQVGIVTQHVFVWSCLCQHLSYKYFLLLCVLDWKAVWKSVREKLGNE